MRTDGHKWLAPKQVAAELNVSTSIYRAIHAGACRASSSAGSPGPAARRSSEDPVPPDERDIARSTIGSWAIAAGVQFFYVVPDHGHFSGAEIDATYGHLVPDSEEYLRGSLIFTTAAYRRQNGWADNRLLWHRAATRLIAVIVRRLILPAQRLRKRVHQWRQSREIAAAREQRLRSLERSRGLLVDAGGAGLPGWITFDIAPDEHGVYVDASKPWPLPDGCARAVRAEHMIEHLDWEEATTCVREMHRVLEPGGVCRICTPDLEWIALAFLERDPGVLEAHREHGYAAPTWAHLPNNYLRMWGHRFIFDFEALRTLFDDAGFTEIERTGFNQSRHGILDKTDSHDLGPLQPLALCVDAVKPA